MTTETMSKRNQSWAGITGINNIPTAQAALAYANAGVRIFPAFEVIESPEGMKCACANPDCDNKGKHPRIKGWREESTTDPEQIREWWTTWPNANIGMATGEASGLFTIDLDVEETDTEYIDGSDHLNQWLENTLGLGWDIDALKTLKMRTGGGGHQLIMVDDTKGMISNTVGWLHKVDIRGRHGLAILPPSRHASGNTYAWINEESPAVMPEQLRSAMVTAKGSSSSRKISADGSRGPSVLGNGDDYRESIRTGPRSGGRDDFFNRYAFELCKRGFSRVDGTKELRRVWNLTPGGGAPSEGKQGPYRWETVEEKISRVWSTITPDPEGRPIEPIADELLQWAKNVGKDAKSKTDPGSEETPEVGTDEEDPMSDGLPFSDSAQEVATDLGNATRFGRVFDGRLKYVGGLGWYLWDGSHWQNGSLNNTHTWELVHDIQEQAMRTSGEDKEKWLKWSVTSQSAAKVSALDTLGSKDSRIMLSADELDSDPWVLATQNATIDLRTGEPVENPKDKFCTRMCGVKYDPSAKAPEWEQHIKLITSRHNGTPDPELARFLQRWAGYSLTGEVGEQKFTFCYGDGANGKNVFVEALVGVLGSYAGSANEQLLTGGGNDHPTVLADLAGLRFVFIDEAPNGKVNSSRLKQLTGSETLKARKMGQDFVSFKARFKIWIAGNSKPRMADTSEGLWRRLDLIPFEVTIPAERRIKNYGKILFETEGSGILNWALEGLREYRQIGLNAPGRVNEARQEYREEEDSFGKFMSDTFDMSSPEREWTPNPVIMGLYTAWCEANGNKFQINMQGIAKELSKRHMKKGETRNRIEMAYSGVSKPEWGWCVPPVGFDLPPNLKYTGARLNRAGGTRLPNSSR